MRKMKIICQGPLGFRDTEDTFSEDDLLLTASGQVKPTRQLREGDVLTRFISCGSPREFQNWTITKLEWLRKAHV